MSYMRFRALNTTLKAVISEASKNTKVLNFQFRYHITKQSGPIFLSYVAYLIPAFAIFWGYLILGERIHLNSILGILLVLLGVYVGQKKLMNKIAN